jgi:transketolase
MLPSALEVVELLAARGLDAGLLHLPTVKPLDTGAIALAVAAAPLLVTLEDHTLPGGFGSAVAEAIVDNDLSCAVLRLGIPDCFAPVVGSREYLLERYGLAPEGIVASITARLRGRLAA